MNLLDIAGAKGARNGYTTYTAIEAFPQHTAPDGFTRTLALRDSDSACFVVFVNGEHADIVATINERSRLTAAQTVARKIADDETLGDSERDSARYDAGQFGEQLDALPKVKAQITLHVASALDHYMKAANSAAAVADAESDADAESEPESE